MAPDLRIGTSQRTMNSRAEQKPEIIPSYRTKDLAPFDLLSHPVWIFDIERKSMCWANTAAVKLWNADSLSSLLKRDFASDMSASSEQRLKSYLEGFHNDERFTKQVQPTAQWTFYPNGKPTPVKVAYSGIRMIQEDSSDKESRLLMLCEGDPIPTEQVDHQLLRSVEMLRHLPLAVAQFDKDGRLMEQNSESMRLFGGSECNGPSFSERFVSKSEGFNFINMILLEEEDKKFYLEAELLVSSKSKDDKCDGFDATLPPVSQCSCWFALKARRSKDPVTAEDVVLCSARDISEIRKAQQEADRAKLAQSEFFAVMAHEIRTPLHQVIGYIDLLEQQTTLPDQISGFVPTLSRSASCLMAIINGVLDYGKHGTIEMNFENVPFHPKNVALGSLAAISVMVEEKKLSLKHEVMDDVPDTLCGDPSRVRQVLLNLLHNAVKFTGTGEVSLVVQRVSTPVTQANAPCVVRFEVRDTGIGISKECASLIFNKYQQADESVTHRYGGTGLGLAICKRLVELMGGTIGVHSKQGQGSLFWFELPFETVTFEQSTPAMLESKSCTRPERDSDQSLHVLVVDDSNTNRRLATALLSRLGHTSSISANGLECLNELERAEYDCVLMDIQMPVMNGFEATTSIRQNGRSKTDLPVIGLTADFRPSEFSKYIEVGMNDCLGKPIRIPKLQECLERVMTDAGKMH